MAKASKQQGKQVTKAAEQQRPLTPFEAMDKLFDSYFPGGWMRPFRVDWPEWAQGSAPFEGKTPKVDVIDRDSEVVVKAELPGVDKKDIDLSVTRTTVSIKATTSHEDKEEKGDYYRCEMSRGVFARTVMLPADVAEDKAKAKFKDGVLELILPKLEQTQRRNITVE